MKLQRAQFVIRSLTTLAAKHGETTASINALDAEAERLKAAPDVLLGEIEERRRFIKVQEENITLHERAIEKAKENKAGAEQSIRVLGESMARADGPYNATKAKADTARKELLKIERERAKFSGEENEARTIIANVDAREAQRQKVEDALFSQYCRQREAEPDETKKARMTDRYLRQQAKINAKAAIANAVNEAARAKALDEAAEKAAPVAQPQEATPSG